jgi:regulator of nucleoside diphosphate kinase
MLIEEIGRATLLARKAIRPDVVTMNATVEFVDEAAGTGRTVQIVFPRDADIAAGRISILTPVGAGLIGLRKGQSIVWPDREGHQRRLTIVDVQQPAS